MPGALAQLPDSARAQRLGGAAETGCAAAASAHAELSPDGAVLAPAAGAFASVTTAAAAQVDVPGLAGALGGAMRAVRSAAPAGVVEQVEALEAEFRRALETVTGNPLLGVLPEGSALSDVVGQVVAEAVDLFERRLEELAEQVFGAEDVAALVEGLALLDGLRTDYPAHADQLSGLLADTLLGVDPAVMDPLRRHLAAVLQLAGRLDATVVGPVINLVRAPMTTAIATVGDAVATLDPTLAADYDELVHALDAVAGAVTGAGAALRPFCADAAAAAAALDLDALVPGYAALLGTVELTGRELVGDVLDSTLEVLDALVEGVTAAAASPNDLAAAVRGLGTDVRTAMTGSAVGQAHAEVVAFVGRIRDAVAAVPFAALRDAVSEMLRRIGAELDDLGIADLAAGIESGLDGLVEQATTITGQATQSVQEALTKLLDLLDEVPIADLAGELEQGVAALGQVVRSLHDTAIGLLDDLTAQLDQLTTLSFEPASDAVISEIDEIKGRLARMNPDALSDESKLAIRAALAVLESLDVDEKVVQVLDAGYAELDGEVRSVLDEIAAGLERLRQSVGELDPGALLKPVTDGLHQIRTVVDSVDAASLTAGLRAELDRAGDQLAVLRPGRLLAPLQPSYDAGQSVVLRLDPQVWGAPLGALHADLVAITDRLDLAPLFADLAEWRRDLVERARNVLLDVSVRAGLPAPLDGWFARVLPFVTGVTDLLTLDPGAAMRELSGRLRAELRPSSLYEPLDEVFEAARDALAGVPEADLVSAATELRDAIVALDELAPDRLVARLREGHRRLVTLADDAFAPATGLAALRVAFHARVDVAVTTPDGAVARVDARFDAVAALLDADTAGSVVASLEAVQAAGLTALSRTADALATNPATASAQASFTRLRADLDRFVPPGLPRTGPLTADVVLGACEYWRPSRRTGELDARLAAFVAALEPAAAALDEAFDAVTDDLRAAAELIDPLALEPIMAEVFDALRAQVDVLDPAELLVELRKEVYLPVAAAVEALDPRALAVRLDAAFERTRSVVLAQLSGLLDAVSKAVAEHLATVRRSVEGLLDTVEGTLSGAVGDVDDVLKQVSDLAFFGIVEKLRQVLDNLKLSFDAEVRRIVRAFDAMLDAAPLGERIHARTAVTSGAA
jgi:uncharacterized protein YoxC